MGALRGWPEQTARKGESEVHLKGCGRERGNALRASIALNILLTAAALVACVWKFTNVRYAIQDFMGGGTPTSRTTGMSPIRIRRASCLTSIPATSALPATA